MIQQSNIIKYAIIAIMVIALIGYDCFNIVHDNFDTEGVEQQPSDIVYFLASALCWLIASSLICYTTFKNYSNFMWTKRFAFIFVGLTINNFVDQMMNDNLVVHISEWVFVITWIGATLYFIKMPIKDKIG